MSISKGAFGQSAKGSFMESAMGARGWGGRDTCVVTKGVIYPPYGCLACQCRNCTYFNLCVSGLTGEMAVFNTTGNNIPLRLSRVSSSLFRLESSGRKVELEFTATAYGFDDSELRAYLWDGAAWSLEETVLIWPLQGSNCYDSQSGSGSSQWSLRGRGDWTDFTSMTVEFDGVQTDIDLACSSFFVEGADTFFYNRRHNSGDINAATYASGLMPNWPNNAGSCDWYVDDSSVQSNAGGTRVRVASFPGDRFGTQRTWTVTARSSSNAIDPVLYFAGTIVLDNAAPCKGTHVIANEFTSFCPVPLESQNVGWGGTATLVVT